MACKRLWTIEGAHAAGKKAAALLWDLDKFFDIIHPDEVRRTALDKSYPLTELKLSLALHTAPRLLQICFNFGHKPLIF